MGQALYRKYRSKSFDSVVGQDHIVKTLKNAVKSGRISHAYLFTGPRGVGKTSVARILAHEVNQLAYTDESTHFDIIEIDAASNRRIDEIRDLRERVRVAPAAAKYKVYIIDEVHMLTREAFNALLKTLEEPPAHAIFILATTEAHKLPETIISRTQRFEFRPVSPAQASKHLGGIAKKEKINISQEALDLLAGFGNGSFRDSISYLDQLSSLGGKITDEDVRSLLGLPPESVVDELLELVWRGDSAGLLKKLIEVEEQGVNPVSLSAALSGRLRDSALHGQIDRPLVDLLKQLSQISASGRPQEALEIALLEVMSRKPGVIKANNHPITPSRPASEKKSQPSPKKSSPGSFGLSRWDDVLERSKAQAASIYTALRLAKPDYSDGVLTLTFQFPLHQKKLAQVKNKDLISDIIKELCGSDVRVETVLRERPALTNDIETETVRPAGAISSVFGSAEVLEA
jgi:DNA polymerase-3 subunit gamma/tau